MDRDVVVTLADVGKRYVKYDDVPTLITGLLRRPRGKSRSKLWALRHVDLEVERGEAFGVIGSNGAGKSTMLAMLAGVTAPTEGVVTVRGRVAPLLSLGVGFNDQLTGRENVYINATILGLTQSEIDASFDDIVSFAELEQFIDTPVKYYSSGMQARLGFSVAVASQPDVLIVDEILAVGDVAFQARSFDRMLELQNNGATILVVSHNLDAIARFCTRALLLHRGTARFLGPASDAISHYHDLVRVLWEEQGLRGGEIRTRDSPIEVVSVDLLDETRSSTQHFKSGDAMTVRLLVRFRDTVSDPYAGLWVTNQASQLVYAANCFGRESGTFKSESVAEFLIDLGIHLSNGTYTVGAWIGWGRGQHEHTTAPAKPFYVSRGPRRGVANLGARFEVNSLRSEANGSVSAPTDSQEAASGPRGP